MHKDRELVERCLSGDSSAFHELVERYQEPVYRVVWRFLRNHHDASEIAQEAFARAWQKLASYDLARPFSVWLEACDPHGGYDCSHGARHLWL